MSMVNGIRNFATSAVQANNRVFETLIDLGVDSKTARKACDRLSTDRIYQATEGLVQAGASEITKALSEAGFVDEGVGMIYS